MDYMYDLGVKVEVKEEEVTVIEYHKDSIPARSYLTIKCKCGEFLTTSPMALHSQGRVCEKCKRHYVGVYPT